VCARSKNKRVALCYPVMSSTNAKQPSLKQKTLLGFFNKSTSATTSSIKAKPSQPAPKTKDNITKALSHGEGEDSEGENMQKKPNHPSSVASSFKSHGSYVSGPSVKDTPPTSDIVDVDSLSDLTEDNEIVEKPVCSTTMYDALFNAIFTGPRKSAK
jgi:hypothetical protein